MPQTALKTAAESRNFLTLVHSHDEVRSTDVQALDGLQQIELITAQETLSEIDLIRQLHQDWYARLDEVDLSTAPGDELLALLETAPNSFAKGLLGGALQVRTALAAKTGRVF